MQTLLFVVLGFLLLDRGAEAGAIELSDCAYDAGPADGRCGTLTVWENRRAATGRQIDLKIVVLPAKSSNPAPDPLFILAGGPGQAATDLISMVRHPLRHIWGQRDLVFVDQRGTGESNPLDCPMPTDAEMEQDLEALMEPLQACVAAFDADLRFYTTPHAMDDLDEVRRALGYERINLWGGSYGTRAALIYMRRYPAAARSAILDGAAPLALQLPAHLAVDAQRALERLFADCRADAGCARRFGDLEERFGLFLQRLDRAPEKHSLQDPLSGQWRVLEINRSLVAGLVRGALYSGEWSSLVPLALDRAVQGDFQPLMGLGGGWLRVTEGMSLGMQLAVLCSEDVARVEGAVEGEDTFMGTEFADFYLKGCEFFPAADLPEGYWEPVRAPVPALVLSGTEDPVTPPRWGEETARHLPQSRHVEVPGTAHNTMASGCVPRLMADFVEAASADSLDLSCLTKVKRPPFFTSYSGPGHPDKGQTHD